MFSPTNTKNIQNQSTENINSEMTVATILSSLLVEDNPDAKNKFFVLLSDLSIDDLKDIFSNQFLI